MPRKIVLLALLVLCSVPSCTPEKFDRKAFFAKWFGRFFPGFNLQSFSDNISGEKTPEEIWRQNSRTSMPEPRTEHHTSNTRPGDNQNHSHVPGQQETPPSGDRVPTDPPEKFTLSGLLNWLSTIVDCFTNPDDCRVHDLLLNRLSKKWNAWRNKYLDSILKFMHFFSEIPLIFLKNFDHFLHRYFHSCPVKIAFVEYACLWFTGLQFKKFLELHANQSPFVLFCWCLFLIVQGLFTVLLLILGTSHMKTIMTSKDSSAVVCCLVLADNFLNYMLSRAFNDALLTNLMIHEQIIYCRIIEGLFRCNTLSCTCFSLVALAFVLWNKTFLWNYASKGSTLQGFDSLTWIGAWLWVLENGWVLITRCYKMGMFPLLHIALPPGWHDSWTAWGLFMVSLGSVLCTFWSTHIFKISFAVLAAAQILIGQ